MKYFLDTEFMENGPREPIVLLSIGIVSEDGREFYAINDDADHASANQWVRENVLPHLELSSAEGILGHGTLDQIRSGLLKWIGEGPEFWGYYSDYDWVVFCQIFGAMINLPKGWPMYCRDIKQLCDSIGNPKLPKQDSAEHNAIHDARWNMKAFKFLEACSDNSKEAICRL